MKVFIYTLIFLLSYFLQSGLAQSDSNSTQMSESFFSVSIDPKSLSNLQSTAEVQSGWKDGYFMQRLGIDLPYFMVDYDVSLIIPIGESGINPYFGAGVNIIPLLGYSIAFDAHAGLEIKLIDEVAVFSEYEATSLLDGKSAHNFNAGINFYF